MDILKFKSSEGNEGGDIVRKRAYFVGNKKRVVPSTHY